MPIQPGFLAGAVVAASAAAAAGLLEIKLPLCPGVFLVCLACVRVRDCRGSSEGDHETYQEAVWPIRGVKYKQSTSERQIRCVEVLPF